MLPGASSDCAINGSHLTKELFPTLFFPTTIVSGRSGTSGMVEMLRTFSTARLITRVPSRRSYRPAPALARRREGVWPLGGPGVRCAA